MEESINKRRGRDRVSELPNLDRFSELPNSLILIILSFLPIRDVVATTILSKRWKNLWTTVPCLNFCELSKYYEGDPEKIRNFVNRTLLFWRGVGNLKFKLDFDWDLYLDLSDDVDVWVRFAVEKEVEELSISLICEEIETSLGFDETEECAYCLPQCLNSCTSIRELSLVGCNLRMPVSPSWNQLKCLKIDGYCFSKWLINRILLGSPQLEVFELRLVESYGNLNICSTSLKKLKIEKYLMHKSDEPSKDKWLRICCPNLEILVISGVLYSKYLFTDVSSVTDVTIGFNGPYDYACGNELLEETLTYIFSSFEGAHKLALSYWCVQVLGVLHKKSLPNVTFFPNVKMLVIKDQTRDTNYEFEAGKCVGFQGELFDVSKYLKFERKLSKSFMLQLKTVDITLNFFKESSFRFIEFLLKYGTMLEDMVIRADKNCFVDWLEVAGRLLSKPKTAQLTLIRF